MYKKKLNMYTRYAKQKCLISDEPFATIYVSSISTRIDTHPKASTCKIGITTVITPRGIAIVTLCWWPKAIVVEQFIPF